MTAESKSIQVKAPKSIQKRGLPFGEEFKKKTKKTGSLQKYLSPQKFPSRRGIHNKLLSLQNKILFKNYERGHDYLTYKLSTYNCLRNSAPPLPSCGNIETNIDTVHRKRCYIQRR